ncbi:hypothetical protein [Dyella sp.]|uniref:hypothetical protein n=1 Tax=Dyella sp. TaxID=1869338 RepID=UPI002ED5B897
MSLAWKRLPSSNNIAGEKERADQESGKAKEQQVSQHALQEICSFSTRSCCHSR